MKTVERRQTQGVHAAHQGGVDETGFDHAPRRAEDLCTGGAGAGHRHRGPLELQPLTQIIRNREGVVGGAVLEGRGQRAGDEIAFAVGEFGLQDARGAGADEDTDALAAPARHRAPGGVQETILPQRQFRESIVPAVEASQFARQAHVVNPGDLADMRIDLDGLEITALQTAPLRQQ